MRWFLSKLLLIPEDLSLRESGIGGQLPTEIGLLTNLKRIVLGGEEFQGSLPSEIGMWTNVGKTVLLKLLFSAAIFFLNVI